MPSDVEHKAQFFSEENQPRSAHPMSARYAMAAICVMLAFAISYALVPLLGQRAPFTFFVAASLIAGWYGGLGPGVWALLIGLLLGDFFFLRPWHQFGPHSPPEMALLLIYASVGVIALAAIYSLHRTKSREERIRDTAWHLRQDVAERSRAEEAVRRAKEKLDFAVEAARLCTWDLDVQACKLEWSCEHDGLLGPGQASAHEGAESFLHHVYPEDRALLTRTMTNCAREGDPCDVEFRVVWADGSIHWILAKGKILRDGNQRPERMSGVMMDITERKRARDHLAESERFVRSALNALGFEVAILDQDGTILEVNQAWRDFAIANQLHLASFGIGTNYLSICDRARGADAVEARSAAAGIRSVARGESPRFSMEYPCHSPTQQRWFILRATRFEGDGFLRLVVSHMNVTELKLAEKAARQSEARARAQYRSFPIPTYTWQRRAGSFVLVDYNEAANAFTHGSIARFMSQTAEEMYPDVPEIIEDISRCFNEKTCIRREMLYEFRSNRERKHLDVTYVFVPPDLVMIHCEDITERKRAEEALRESQGRLQAILDNSPTMIFLKGPEGRYLLSNRKFETITHQPGEEIIGKTDQEIFPPEQAAAFRANDLKVLKHGVPLEFEEVALHDDGPHTSIVHKFPLRDQSGRAYAIGGIVADITQRKRAEEALQQSQERYHALSDATFDAVVIHEQGVALEVNHSLCEMFDYEPGEVLGKNVIDLLVEPESRETIVQHLQTGSEEPYEAWVRRKDGSKLLVELRGRNLSYRGRAVRVVSAHDITERKRAEQALWESDRVARRQLAELESLYESAPVGRCFLDANLRVVRINKWLANVIGRPPAEQIGRSVWEMVPTVQHIYEPILRKVLEMGVAVKDLELHRPMLSDPAQTPRDWLVSLDVLKEGDHVLGVNAVVSEITERKRMEEELQRTLALLTTTLESTANGILVADLAGKVVRYNQKFKAMWQIPDALLALRDDSKLLDYVLEQLSEPEAFLNKVQELKDHPEAESQDELRFKDGRVFERYSQPHRVGSEIVGRVWSFHDVTEHKQIEEAVRRSEAQLHELADAMPQIVWTALPDGKIDFVNKRWFEHSDLLEAEPHLSKAWSPMIHPEDASRAARTVEAAFQTGQPFQVEVRIQQKGNGYRWHLARALPLRDESGRIFRWFGTCTDIEDQKRTEHDLQTAKKQLDLHAQTLERRVVERTAKLEETIKSLEGVLYHIAHDLRAPLRAMSGFAQMLQEHQLSRLDEEGKDFAERIVVGARRMDCLIQDLLTYGRLGHSRMRFTRVPLERSLERVLHSLATEIKRRNAEVEVTKPLPTVRADSVVLDEVLIHLLNNALTFMAPTVTPRIRIWAKNRGAVERLWIQDNGIGIDAEHWGRIFRVFERLHRVDEYTGTGIGLAVVWKGMERMGGSVGVESKVGEGSRFWLELPGDSGDK